MAFPIERARTALLFGLIFLAMLFGHTWTYIIVWAVILGISLYELNNLVGTKYKRTSIFIYGIIPFLLAIYHFVLDQSILDVKYVIGFLVAEIIFLTVLSIDLIFFKTSKFLVRFPSLVALLYVGNAVGLLIILGSYPKGVKLVFSLLILIWSADIGAYFIGKAFGRHKLIPWVSPNKTWEGFVGGITSAIVAAIILFYISGELPIIHWIVLSIIVACFGLLGDLIESRLKRLTGHKDSGTLLPGHGGMLDRFDAVYGFIPFAFLYLYWLDIIQF